MAKRIAILALLCAASSPVLGQEEARIIETKSYRLEHSGPAEEANEHAQVLQEAFKGFQKFFKKKPKGTPLMVRFFEMRAPWVAAIEADGGKPPATQADYYNPENEVAYLYRQETVYGTRLLLIHAACRQYHFLARTRNKALAAQWYEQGVEDFVSAHIWDGKSLTLGVLPLVSVDDHASKALEAVSREDFDFTKYVDGEVEASRPISWALVRFLATGENGKPFSKFGGFSAKMDGGVAPLGSFKRHFGSPRELKKRFLFWLDREQEPWSQAFPDWFAVAPDRLRGIASRKLGVCYLKGPVEVLSAKFKPRKGGGWKAGMILHFTSKDDYTIALIDWGGYITVRRKERGGWKIFEQGEGPGPTQKGIYPLQAFRKGGNVYFMIGELAYGPYELPSTRLGLCVERADLTFYDLSWR
ncbi:MAG: hypothetical protein ACYSUN_05445 [Planctomycetota bacterium]|jgi:hypothetical protein